jgi:hypothetical protein
MLEVSAKSKTVSGPVTYAKRLIFKQDSEAVTERLHSNSGQNGAPVTNGIAASDCLAQIDRLVSDPLLCGSEALCKLLQYLAHHTLHSPADHLKEYQIATEVLGRLSDFDPQSDSCVRVQVGRLRTKLAEYYSSVGARDPILVDLPKGRYALSFDRKVSSSSEKAAHSDPVDPRWSTSVLLRWKLAAVGALALAIGCCATLWIQNRSLQRQLTPWRYSPAVAQLWSGFLDAHLETDVVMEDDAFLLVQNISHETFDFNDYLNRTYIVQLQTQDFSPDIHEALRLIGLKNLGRATGVRMAQHILALDPLGKSLHFYNAREYMPSLLTQDNVILLGGPLTNPWVQLFENRLNFTEAPYSERNSPVTNHAPAHGEQEVYMPSDTVQYSVVAYLPNSGHNSRILLVQGTSSEATEAGTDFLLSEDQLSGLLKRLHATEFPYFEVLLKTSQVTGTPLTTTIEAYRTYPNLH